MMDSDKQIDMPHADVVEFSFNDDGRVWVNVDGVCLLRIGHADFIEMVDGNGIRTHGIVAPEPVADLNESLGGADELGPHSDEQMRLAMNQPYARGNDKGGEGN